MRIHGIHLQGLDTPRGTHQVAFDPGYNAILVSDRREARGWIALLRALLYAESELTDPGRWTHDPGADAARAGLSISFGNDSYRVIADLSGGRLVLARYNATSREYERVSTDAADVLERLKAAGLPPRNIFDELFVSDPEEATASVDDGTGEVPTPVLKVAVKAPVPVAAAEEAVAGQGDLREARETFLRLERELKHVEAALAERAVLSEHVDDLETKVGLYRELLVQRSKDVQEIEAQRRTLLDERNRLRGVPQAQMSGMWLGVALGALGAVVGHLIEPWFFIATLGGLGVAAFGLWVSRAARRRLGAVEARLAGLRVRERAIERHFETESAPLRGLMQSLRVESSDDLMREASDYRGLVRRAANVRSDYEKARLAFPEDAESVLQDDAPEVEPVVESPPSMMEALEADEAQLRAASAIQLPDPDELAELAARWIDRPVSEVRDIVSPVLPLYLRALTRGVYTHARYNEGQGWMYRPAHASERVEFDAIVADEQPQVRLAFRLAVIEVLAPGLRVPLFVGADPSFDGAEGADALARALRRVGAAVQVVQFAAGNGAWTEHAGTVRSLAGA